VIFKLHQADEVRAFHIPRESTQVFTHWENQAAVPMILEYMTAKPHICFQCLDLALDSFLNENYAKHLL